MLNIQILKIQKEGSLFIIDGTTFYDGSYKVFKHISNISTSDKEDFTIKFSEIVPKFSVLNIEMPVCNEIDLDNISEEEYSAVLEFCNTVKYNELV